MLFNASFCARLLLTALCSPLYDYSCLIEFDDNWRISEVECTRNGRLPVFDVVRMHRWAWICGCRRFCSSATDIGGAYVGLSTGPRWAFRSCRT
jgi:hypothetical protein